MNLTKKQFHDIFIEIQAKSYEDFSKGANNIISELKSEDKATFENLIMELFVAQRTSIDRMIYSLLSELLKFSDNDWCNLLFNLSTAVSIFTPSTQYKGILSIVSLTLTPSWVITTSTYGWCFLLIAWLLVWLIFLTLPSLITPLLLFMFFFT